MKGTTLLLCQAKGDTVGLCPQKFCVPTHGFREEFCNSGSRAGVPISKGQDVCRAFTAFICGL